MRTTNDNGMGEGNKSRWDESEEKKSIEAKHWIECVSVWHQMDGRNIIWCSHLHLGAIWILWGVSVHHPPMQTLDIGTNRAIVPFSFEWFWKHRRKPRMPFYIISAPLNLPICRLTYIHWWWICICIFGPYRNISRREDIQATSLDTVTLLLPVENCNQHFCFFFGHDFHTQHECARFTHALRFHNDGVSFRYILFYIFVACVLPALCAAREWQIFCVRGVRESEVNYCCWWLCHQAGQQWKYRAYSLSLRLQSFCSYTVSSSK